MRTFASLLLLLLGIITPTLLAEVSVDLDEQKMETRIKDQEESLINWDQIDPKKWMIFSDWKKIQALKNAERLWRLILKEKRVKEPMARIIQGVGDVKIVRGIGEVHPTFRSTIREGDEVVTGKNGYVWIYILDGSMLRISPRSSISFKEINIGVKENMNHFRLNYGNILLLDRDTANFAVTNERETDTLFQPLDYYDANPEGQKLNRVKEDELFTYLDDQTVKNQYERLNQLIEKNNREITYKPTFSYLVMPNATLSGYNLRAELITVTGGKSYFKLRPIGYINPKVQETTSKVKLTFRGFENERTFEPGIGNWYEVEPNGRDVQESSELINYLGVGEFITKRVPTLMVARELLYAEYSAFAFKSMPALELASNYGYRLWGDLADEKSDMSTRIKFLNEYVRRAETSNINVAKKFRERMSTRGEILTGLDYGPFMYSEALENFLRKQETSIKAHSETEILNSTTRNLWKRMHAIK